MNEFTKEEKQILESIRKPAISFSVIKIILDEKAINNGYENHDDFLLKTDWQDRFNNDE